MALFQWVWWTRLTGRGTPLVQSLLRVVGGLLLLKLERSRANELRRGRSSGTEVLLLWLKARGEEQAWNMTLLILELLTALTSGRAAPQPILEALRERVVSDFKSTHLLVLKKIFFRFIYP